MYNLSLSQILTRLVVMLVVTSLLGFFLALATRLLGDKGPQHDGRLTLNPFPHLELLAIIPAILFQTGWIRPMNIDARLLRFRLAGLAGAILAALAATLTVLTALWWARSLIFVYVDDPRAAALISNMVNTALQMGVGFAVFSIVPILPFLAGLLTRAIAPALGQRLESFGLLVRIAIIAALATGMPQSVLAPLNRLVWTLLTGR